MVTEIPTWEKSHRLGTFYLNVWHS